MNSRNLLLWIAFLFFGWVINTSTAQTFDWVASFGGSRVDHGRGLTTDSEGFVYTLGSFRDSGDFDPGPDVVTLVSDHRTNGFIQKFDDQGDLLWAKSFGGGSLETFFTSSMAVDHNDDIIICGVFEGDSMDAAPGTPKVNIEGFDSYDIFLSKINPSGNLVWSVSIGGDGFDAPRDVVTDDEGNVYFCGGFEGSVDFDPGSGTNVLTANGTFGESDLFVCKLNSSGELVWATGIGGPEADVAEGLDLDDDGNLYVTGTFNETVDFGSTTVSSNGFSDAFVLKLNPNGDVAWVKTFGGTFHDYARSISASTDGDLIIAGDFVDTVDFDPGTGVNTSSSNGVGYDAFVLKLDGTGDFNWVKTFGGTGLDIALCVETDVFGNIYTGGYFVDTVDFDPNSGVANFSSKGSFDVFIHKLDQDGNFLWAETFGGKMSDFIGNQLTIGPDGSLYSIGHFNDTVLFDANTPSSLQVSQESDVYLIKYVQEGFTTQVSETYSIFPLHPLVYPNPTNRSLIIELDDPYEMVKVQVMNMMGQVVYNDLHSAQNLIEINIEGEAGIYLVQTEVQGIRTITKVIKH